MSIASTTPVSELQSLVKTWRREAVVLGRRGAHWHGKLLQACADELEAALRVAAPPPTASAPHESQGREP